MELAELDLKRHRLRAAGLPRAHHRRPKPPSSPTTFHSDASAPDASPSSYPPTSRHKLSPLSYMPHLQLQQFNSAANRNVKISCTTLAYLVIRPRTPRCRIQHVDTILVGYSRRWGRVQRVDERRVHRPGRESRRSGRCSSRAAEWSASAEAAANSGRLSCTLASLCPSASCTPVSTSGGSQSPSLMPQTTSTPRTTPSHPRIRTRRMARRSRTSCGPYSGSEAVQRASEWAQGPHHDARLLQLCAPEGLGGMPLKRSLSLGVIRCG
ncbi:hypothetical protein DFP72DRAFT_893448 [Ephemerocybe angulata]|uniref:Uncharacterized protein n=1 Tax=Ephemerocybe angulata TaxID=980116 RepID=A0A8H6I127_9AGAR|nr:hypothetical protein DFP72DRAFT_893448 [Tulosesus angulatus]